MWRSTAASGSLLFGTICSPTYPVTDLEQVRRDASDGAGDIFHSGGDDRGNLPSRRGDRHNRLLQGVLADLCLAQPFIHRLILIGPSRDC